MIKKLSTSITFLILISMILTSCKKYPEGPTISFRTVQGRLTGEWEIIEFNIDGQDFMDSLKNHPAYCTYDINAKQEGSFSLVKSCSDGAFGGEIILVNKEKIYMSAYYPNPTNPFGPLNDDSVSVHWDIIRLTNKEMKLRTDFTDGKEYEISFDKIKNNHS
ncbi:MAG: hypothetical protein ABII90_04735 [Bacteroidota bacterium]